MRNVIQCMGDMVLLDPGTFCVTKILTHKTLIFVFHGPSGMRKMWVMALNCGRNMLSSVELDLYFESTW